MVAEGGAGGFDIGGEFGFVERFSRRRSVLFGDDVVYGLLHMLLFLL